MTTYNVHLYRQMRLYFPNIHADTHSEAATIAAAKDATEANLIDDCDGTNIAALVDVLGDADYENTKLVSLDPIVDAAHHLQAALEELLAVTPATTQEPRDAARYLKAKERARAALERSRPSADIIHATKCAVEIMMP
jgi:hypothetical protein